MSNKTLNSSSSFSFLDLVFFILPGGLCKKKSARRPVIRHLLPPARTPRAAGSPSTPRAPVCAPRAPPEAAQGAHRRAWMRHDGVAVVGRPAPAPIMESSAGGRSGASTRPYVAPPRRQPQCMSSLRSVGCVLHARRAPAVQRASRGRRRGPCGRPQTRPRRHRVWGLQLDEYSHQHLLLRAVVAAPDVLEAAVPARVLDGRPAPARGRGAPPLAPQNTAVSRFTASRSSGRGRRRARSL